MLKEKLPFGIKERRKKKVGEVKERGKNRVYLFHICSNLFALKIGVGQQQLPFHLNFFFFFLIV